MDKVIGVIALMMIGGLIASGGCDDEASRRLANMAEESTRIQARHNERMAEQFQRVADASKTLVEHDAQARQEMITAHADLQKDIEAARHSVDRQRDDLQRRQDSFVAWRATEHRLAEGLGAFGLLLACLLPLVFAAYVIYLANRPTEDTSAIGEMLLEDACRETPRLVVHPTPRISQTDVPQVEHHETSDSQLD